MTLHIVERHRVNRAGDEMVDIMIGIGGSENWDMFAEKLTRKNANLILEALEQLEHTCQGCGKELAEYEVKCRNCAR